MCFLIDPALKCFFLTVTLDLYLRFHRRHQDKHIRPYVCAHPLCSRKSFGDKGGFERYQRELHSSQSFNCPITSCPRSRRGFSRKYNLLEQQKRKHKLRHSRLLRARSNTIDLVSTSDDSAQTLEYGHHIADFEKETAEVATLDLNGGSTTAETSLRAKLRELQILHAQMVADIDEDIVALQKALPVFG